MDSIWTHAQFDCRTIADGYSILSVDNAKTCERDGDYDSTWLLFTILAVVGVLSVSFGVPLILLYTMKKAMNKRQQQIHSGQKKMVVAFNEFGEKFDYVVCHSHGIMSFCAIAVFHSLTILAFYRYNLSGGQL